MTRRHERIALRLIAPLDWAPLKHAPSRSIQAPMYVVFNFNYTQFSHINCVEEDWNCVLTLFLFYFWFLVVSVCVGLPGIFLAASTEDPMVQ